MDSKVPSDFWIRLDIEKQPHEIIHAALWLMTQRRLNMVGYSEMSEQRFAYESKISGEWLGRAIQALPQLFVAVGEGYWCKCFIRDQFGAAQSLVTNNIRYVLRKHMLEVPAVVVEMILMDYPELKELWDKRPLPEGWGRSNSNSNSNSNRSVVRPAREEPAGGKARPKALAEVVEHGQTIGMSSDMASEFFDHFEANGWKQASGLAIKSWKSACSGWLRRQKRFGNKNLLTRGAVGGTEIPFDPKNPHAHTGGVPVAN